VTDLLTRLRAVGPTDNAMILQWRNDEFIVARSSSRRRITAEEHAGWFERVLTQREPLVFIVEHTNEAVGIVRFDRAGVSTSAVISVFLQERHTGQGIGVEAIRLGCEKARETWPVRRIVACVRAENGPAGVAFEKAGFRACRAAGDCPADHRCFELNEEK